MAVVSPTFDAVVRLLATARVRRLQAEPATGGSEHDRAAEFRRPRETGNDAVFDLRPGGHLKRRTQATPAARQRIKTPKEAA